MLFLSLPWQHLPGGLVSYSFNIDSMILIKWYDNVSPTNLIYGLFSFA